MEARSDTDVQIARYTCRGERLIETSSSWCTKVSLRIAGVEQLYQAKRIIRGIGNGFVLDLFSKLAWVSYFDEPLGQVVASRGPFFCIGDQE